MAGETNSAHREDDLLAHLGWIKALARRMAADAHRADDLAQETYAAALHAPPRDALSIRGWLRTVMQNLVRQGGRSAERRLVREALAARAERVDATDDLIARADLQRKIVETVLALEEPYRSTILLRFFEDLPPREIARRQGVPATTVQSRLTRGLRLLREQQGGVRDLHGAWIFLLAPLAKSPHRLLAPTLGGMIVNTKLVLAVLSAAVVVTVAVMLRLDDPAPAPAVITESAAQDAEPLSSPDAVALDVARGEAVRTQAAPADAPAPAVTTAVAPIASVTATQRVRGRVLDAEGVGLGGVALVFDPGATGEKVHARSRAGGVFELETTRAGGTIAAEGAELATVRAGWYRASSSREPIVIVAPAIDVGGTVLDPHRAPLSGARVSLAMPRDLGTRFVESLEATSVLAWSALTDAQGRFALERVPQVEGAVLRVLVDGYEPAMQPEPRTSDAGMLFVLARPTVLAKGALRGRVLDAERRPVADARVAVGVTSGVSDERGEFALDLSRAVTSDAVTAVKAGFRAARMERPSEPIGDDTGWPQYVELVLGGPALSIEGRVVDEDDRPRAGMRVWVSDPTPFGLIGRVPTSIENLTAGAPLPQHALEPDPNPPAQDGDANVVNRSSGGPPTACWYWVETGPDGRFTLAGLDDRKYVLRVLDPQTLEQVTNDAIFAGDHDARIVMKKPAVYEKLAGRIVTIGDRPVAGVRIMLRRTCYEVQTRYFGGNLGVLMMSPGSETSSDADGRFEFAGVPRDGVFFALRSDALVPCDWHIPAGADPANLEVRVDVRCQFEVRLKDAVDRADGFAVLDESGETLDLIEMNEESVHMNSSEDLVGGRSGVLSTSSSARTLELYKGAQVVERHAIRLSPDEVNVIEL